MSGVWGGGSEVQFGGFMCFFGTGTKPTFPESGGRALGRQFAFSRPISGLGVLNPWSPQKHASEHFPEGLKICEGQKGPQGPKPRQILGNEKLT